ncbi:MAG: dihydrofolate reductase family protein [Bacteroidota bacterium]
MRKIMATINMTLDGHCDHTDVIADNELHRHFNELLKNAGTILYGRTTYQLMEASWPPIVLHPTGQAPIDEFALLIENIEKIVFSRTLKTLSWKNSRLAQASLEEAVRALRAMQGKEIFAGSPSLIAALSNMDLIDEYQLALQPLVAGKGLILFKNHTHRLNLRLLQTKILSSGVVILYYARS